MIMTTGLDHVLGKLREIRELAVRTPRQPQTTAADALSDIADRAARLLSAIEGPTTLARQIGESFEIRTHRAPDPEVEKTAELMIEKIREARRLAHGAKPSTSIPHLRGALYKIDEYLSGTLRITVSTSDPAAVRARLVELTDAAIGEVWGNDEMGIEDTPRAIIGVIESMTGADAMEELLLRELQSRAACRVEMHRRALIRQASQRVTEEHLWPALRELGIESPESYVLEWRETGDVIPGE
jgi:hypothetical protein